MPEEVSNIAEICYLGGPIKHAVALNKSGQIIGWHIYSGKINKSLLPDFTGKAVSLRGRGEAAAAQLENGSWLAWGNDTELIQEINSLSPAVDISFFNGSGTYYLYWIEPADEPAVEKVR
ncbi:MAG: hypothetical protein P1V20_17230 [Verrucomicrobiales bacterium]|nr:hypothetical protein [Verrucomicrobiales bacterium]